MAGKFRGDVGKLTKPKKNKGSKKAKAKKVVSMVKRSPKLAEAPLLKRIAELTGGADAKSAGSVVKVTKVSASTATSKIPVGKAAMEVVGGTKTKERVVPERDAPLMRTSAEAVGLKILNQAMKNQSHNKLLTFQNRHDYEYRLRSVATSGVVQLFNSLAQSRKASAALDALETQMTSDKVQEKKQVVSREAFLAALRQPRD